MKKDRMIKHFVQKARVNIDPEAHRQVFAEICARTGMGSVTETTLLEKSFWRNLMHNRMVQATMAVVIVIGAICFTMLPSPFEAKLSAAEILEEAAAQIPDKIKTIQIEAKVRSYAGDNFSGLAIDQEFIPMKIQWKQKKEGAWWRVDKGTTKRGRSLSNNGKKMIACMYISEKEGIVIVCPPFPQIGPFDTGWLAPLVDPKKLLENEYRNAIKEGSDNSVTHSKEKVDGKEVLVVKVRYRANVPEGDYLRNKFIAETDHTNIYFFDAKTKEFLNMQIVAHADKKDVVIFQTTKISCDQPIEDSAFDIKIPKNFPVRTLQEMEMPQVVPDNKKYEAMTPKEAATAFFTACNQKDWKTAQVFLKIPLTPEIKEYLGGLEIVEIGKPFQSEAFKNHKSRQENWIVPYHIRMKSGDEKKHNLGLRKQLQAPSKRFMIDGGL